MRFLSVQSENGLCRLQGRGCRRNSPTWNHKMYQCKKLASAQRFPNPPVRKQWDGTYVFGNSSPCLLHKSVLYWSEPGNHHRSTVFHESETFHIGGCLLLVRPPRCFLSKVSFRLRSAVTHKVPTQEMLHRLLVGIVWHSRRGVGEEGVQPNLNV